MDLGEDVTERQTAITSKGVAHTGAGGHDTGRGEQHADQREHEQASAASLVVGGIHEDLQQGASGRLDNGVNIVEHEQETTEEEEAGNHADTNAVKHDARTLDVRLGDLLDHVCHAVESSEGEGTLEKTEKPCEPIRPADLVDEFSVDEGPTLEVGRSASKEGDADDDEASHGPVEGGLGDERQQSVGKGIDEDGDEVEAKIDQELVPCLGLVVLVEEGNDVQHKGASKQATGGSQCDPAGHVNPAGDVADTSAPFLPRDDSRPVVLTSGGGVCGQELGQGGGEAQVTDAGHNQAPDDGAGTARGQGEGDGGGERSPGVEDSESQTQHGNHGEVPLELLLVSQVLQSDGIVGRGGVVCRVLHGDDRTTCCRVPRQRWRGCVCVCECEPSDEPPGVLRGGDGSKVADDDYCDAQSQMQQQ